MNYAIRMENVEAIQYKNNIRDIVSFLKKGISEGEQFVKGSWIKSFEVETLIGPVKVLENDWLIKNSNNEVTVFKPVLFEKMFIEIPQPEKCECGKGYKSGGNICFECFNKEQEQIKMEDYKKAKKVNHLEYEGRVLGMSGFAETIEEYMYDYIENFEEDYPKWIFGAKLSYTPYLNLYDAICQEIENYGHEDMANEVDFKANELEEAQKLIDKWSENQDVATYEEDRSIVIDLSEIHSQLMKTLK